MVAAFVLALPVKASAPVEIDISTRSGIEDYLTLEASKRSIDPSIPIRVVDCESDFVIGAVGDNGAALGLPQFHKETFYRMKRLSGEEKMYEYGDERTGLRMLVWAISEGHGNEWTCYRSLK